MACGFESHPGHRNVIWNVVFTEPNKEGSTLVTKILKYCAVAGYVFLTFVFTFMGMACSQGIAAMPGFWIMEMSGSFVLWLLGFTIAICLFFLSLAIPIFCTMASIEACAQCFAWARGGPTPSVWRCSSEASAALDHARPFI